jgi:glutamine amidotransferase
MIAIIDSGGANLTSVLSAFDRLGIETVFTADEAVIRSADKVVLPGVGAAGDAMKKLHHHNLIDVIPTLTQPVIGICVGMQLLFAHSEEGDTKTLGIFDANVVRFKDTPGMAVPHMGWNEIRTVKDHPLFHGLPEKNYFYFANSYHAPVGDCTIGACSYSNDFTAIAAKGNFMGWQFHPERSGPVGAQIIKNFCELSAGDLSC